MLSALLVEEGSVAGTPSQQLAADEWDRFDVAHFCVELDEATKCIRLAPPLSMPVDNIAGVSATASGKPSDDSDDDSERTSQQQALPPFDPWGGRVFVGATLGTLILRTCEPAAELPWRSSLSFCLITLMLLFCFGQALKILLTLRLMHST